MCLSTPSIPTPKPVQEVKQPDSISEIRRKPLTGAGMAGGTWLTGSGGVPTSATNTGSTTLLGG